MQIEISLGEGKHVDARLKEFIIRTDQPMAMGGEGSAPTPFDFFLASIGTCAGYFVLAFCQERKIPTEKISLIQRVEMNKEKKKLEKLSIEIRLPDDFPMKYRGALVRAAEQCAVKKAIHEPPQFEISASSSSVCVD